MRRGCRRMSCHLATSGCRLSFITNLKPVRRQAQCRWLLISRKGSDSCPGATSVGMDPGLNKSRIFARMHEVRTSSPCRTRGHSISRSSLGCVTCHSIHLCTIAADLHRAIQKNLVHNAFQSDNCLKMLRGIDEHSFLPHCNFPCRLPPCQIPLLNFDSC